MPITIRTATPADIAALTLIDSVAATDPQRATEIARWAASGKCLLACDAGGPLGYAVLDDSFFARRFMTMLMVGPDGRERGVGTTLVRAAIDSYPQAELWTSCNRSNAAARNLFRKLGFIRCGFITGLDPGDPELIWRRPAEP